jgi:hypothetical protein
MCDLHLAIHIFLYVYVAKPDNAAAKYWLQDAAGNQDKHGGHLIGDPRLIGCGSY